MRRYAVYRNGVLLGQPAATGFLARSLAPATPYRFTVAAIDGAGHRSPEGVLDTATQAPLPATGPAYAYMLATTGTSFEDLQRHYRQIAVVSPTYYWLGRDLAIQGQDDPAGDELGAAARHRRRAARGVARTRRSCTRCSRARPTAPT